MFEFFKEKILSLIYPPICIFCENLTHENDLVCDTCKKNVKINTSVRPLLEFEEVIYCISPFEYKSKAKDAACKFKFYGHRNYAKYFSEIISGEIIKNFPNLKFNFITATPLSKKRKQERGYNQSEWLAKSLGEKLNLEYEESLIKIKDNFPQHELPFNERILNVRGVYKVNNLVNIRGKNILLCDDIITTGNTLKECVKILKRSGAKNILCCTIAYA